MQYKYEQNRQYEAQQSYLPPELEHCSLNLKWTICSGILPKNNVGSFSSFSFDFSTSKL